MKNRFLRSLLLPLLAAALLLTGCSGGSAPVAEAAPPQPTDWMTLDMAWVLGQDYDGVQIMEIRRQSDTHLEIAHVPVFGVQSLDDKLASSARERMTLFEQQVNSARTTSATAAAATAAPTAGDVHFMLECAVTQDGQGVVSVIFAQQDSLRVEQGLSPLITVESYDKATGVRVDPTGALQLTDEVKGQLSEGLRKAASASGTLTGQEDWLVAATQSTGTAWGSPIAQKSGAALVVTPPSGSPVVLPFTQEDISAAKKALETPPTTTKPAASSEDKDKDKTDTSGKKLVALTFDDGPTKTHTPRLLDILAEYNVKCTFFMQGVNVKARPDTVARVYNEGHEIGNHTYDHPKLTEISFDEVDEQLNKTADLIEDACGFRPRLVRPPYGSTTYSLRDHMRDALDMPCIKWSVDARDSFTDSSSEIIQTCLDETQDGDIILLHDTHDYSVDAVPGIIEGLQAKGFTFVTVSELLTRNGDSIKGGESYQYMRPEK